MENLLDQKVKFLRNKLPFGTYEEALTTIKTKLESLTDGEIVLASYLKTGEGETTAKVRTLLGIRRDIVEGNARQTGYEIFDNEAANDAILALDATVGSTTVAEGKHVAVQVVEADGKLTTLTVTENDIASAALLGTKEDAKNVDTAFGRIAKEVADRTAAIEALDVTVSSNDTNVNVSITETDGILTDLTVSEDYAEITRTATTSTATTPAENAAIDVKTGDGGKLIKASDLAKVAAYAADKATEEMHRVDKKIADLNDTKTGSVDYTSVTVDTAAGNVSGVTVTQKIQSVSAADSTDTNKKGLAEASDVKAYVDSQSAAASTTVKHGAGIEVTESEKEDGHIEYQVASNLIFQYNDSSAGSAATITLKSAVREGEKQVTYGTVNVSDIIGNGVLDHSLYNKTTDILSLFFKQADGTLKEEQIDLKEMLDLDDVVIGETSKDYLKVTLSGGEGEEKGMLLDTKMVTMDEAHSNTAAEGEPSNAVTGLADALDVKTYIDQKTSDLAVTAEGDDYVSASVNAATDNKHVVVSTDVKNVTASAGTRGTWTVSDNGAATITGEIAPSISGVDKSLMDGKQAIDSVKTYVDAKVAAEAAERAAKIEGAIKALDVQDTAIENQYISKVDEVDGKVQLTRTALPVISVASDNSSVNVSNTNGAVNVRVNIDDASIKISDVDGHLGQLTVGTIDCGTY